MYSTSVRKRRSVPGPSPRVPECTCRETGTGFRRKAARRTMPAAEQGVPRRPAPDEKAWEKSVRHRARQPFGRRLLAPEAPPPRLQWHLKHLNVIRRIGPPAKVAGCPRFADLGRHFTNFFGTRNVLRQRRSIRAATRSNGYDHTQVSLCWFATGNRRRPLTAGPVPQTDNAMNCKSRATRTTHSAPAA